MSAFDLIAFDADDTLWHSESLYADALDRFKQLLAQYEDPERIAQQLHDTEMHNLQHYGYGIKGFVLSMVESAVEISAGRVTGTEIRQILDLAKEMLGAEIQLLDHVRETVTALADVYPLMLITKGDLIDQEAKIARSGLRPYFRHVEIVSDKTQGSYAALLAKYGLDPARFLMVGNSLRSDVLPVLALGGTAVHVPYPITWTHEAMVPTEEERRKYYELQHLGLLPALIEQLNRSAG